MIISLLVIALVALLTIGVTCLLAWVPAPAGHALLLSGGPFGLRIVTGRGAARLPLLERVDLLDLRPWPLKTAGEGELLRVAVGEDPAALLRAATRLLQMPRQELTHLVGALATEAGLTRATNEQARQRARQRLEAALAPLGLRIIG